MSCGKNAESDSFVREIVMDLAIDNLSSWIILVFVGASSLGVPALFWMHASYPGPAGVRVWIEAIFLAAGCLAGTYLGVVFVEEYAPSLRFMHVIPVVGAFLMGQTFMFIILACKWCERALGRADARRHR